MKQVTIPGTDLATSRFIFGTSALFNAGSSTQRRRLLDQACAAGFTHFDTAPYYGFGTAERDLGPVLAAQQHVTVTTKVGIYSPGTEEQPGWSVLLRKSGGKIAPSLSRPLIDWTVTRARTSLEGSLRRLGRGSVDLFMLHEPDRELLNTDEWLSWLETERKTGRVRRFGLALETRQVGPFLAEPTPLNAIIQTLDSLAGREADALVQKGQPLQITYGYVSAARRGGTAVDVAAVLEQALCRNPSGAIIVSTKRADRLNQYAKIVAV